MKVSVLLVASSVESISRDNSLLAHDLGKLGFEADVQNPCVSTDLSCILLDK